MIEDLLRLTTLLEKYPNTLNLDHVKVIRDANALLEYFIVLEQGQCIDQHEIMPIASKSLACSVCKGGMPLYRKDDDWFCLEHIPKTITFPIGMPNNELIASGRKVPDWMEKSIWNKK